MRTITHGPVLALLALISLAVFGQWLQQAQKQTPRVDSKQEAAQSVGGNDKASEHAPAHGEPPGKPEHTSGAEHPENSEIWGVKRGEWLLFLATLGLWYATWRLVR